MIIEIGDIIIDKISGLSVVDKIAGVVRPLSYSEVDKDKKSIKKSFPASCKSVFTDECDSKNKRYFDLCPDDDKKSVIYLEDKGIVFNKIERHKMSFTATYDLVGWLNMPKLGYSGCSFSAQVVASIIKLLSADGGGNTGIYQTVFIQVSGQREKSFNPFLKYSYNVEKQQFLMYPFDYFVLPIRVDFLIDERCITEVQIGPPLNCSELSSTSS